MVWFGGGIPASYSLLSLFLSPKTPYHTSKKTLLISSRVMALNPLVPDYGSSIVEPAAVKILENMQLTEVSCSPLVAEEPVRTNVIRFPLEESSSNPSRTPIVLVHGFDSSCLEYRRILPLLAHNRDVYAVDVLGWGFNDHTGVNRFDPEAKLEHLRNFLEQHVRTPCVLVGASLGGGIAFTVASQSPHLVSKVVLIDAQGFIDGNGPSAFPPAFYKFGVGILKSRALRMFANYLSYKNITFASWEAMTIGRLHCLIDGWERAACEFSSSGGFILSDKISSVRQETLLLWGREDRILEPSTAYRFQALLPRSKLVWVENCGHVPHLEQAEVTAREILAFVDSTGS